MFYNPNKKAYKRQICELCMQVDIDAAMAWRKKHNAVQEPLFGHEFYSSNEAAKLLRCSVKTIRKRIKDGSLSASRVGYSFVIRRDALRDYYTSLGL